VRRNDVTTRTEPDTYASYTGGQGDRAPWEPAPSKPISDYIGRHYLWQGNPLRKPTLKVTAIDGIGAMADVIMTDVADPTQTRRVPIGVFRAEIANGQLADVTSYDAYSAKVESAIFGPEPKADNQGDNEDASSFPASNEAEKQEAVAEESEFPVDDPGCEGDRHDARERPTIERDSWWEARHQTRLGGPGTKFEVRAILDNGDLLLIPAHIGDAITQSPGQLLNTDLWAPCEPPTLAEQVMPELCEPMVGGESAESHGGAPSDEAAAPYVSDIDPGYAERVANDTCRTPGGEHIEGTPVLECPGCQAVKRSTDEFFKVNGYQPPAPEKPKRGGRKPKAHPEQPAEEAPLTEEETNDRMAAAYQHRIAHAPQTVDDWLEHVRLWSNTVEARKADLAEAVTKLDEAKSQARRMYEERLRRMRA